MTDSVKVEAVRAEGLSKRFGHTFALRSVDLSIGEREFWVIFGPNGAGKTTLIAILATILRPTSGRVAILGLPAGESGEQIRQSIGVVSHHSYLYGDLTPYENLMLFGRLFGVLKPRDRARAALAETGLEPWMHQRVRALSRGLHQRLSIARALLHDPALVLLDEPSAGVDHHAGLGLRSLLRSLHGQGRTVVMTTHELAAGLELATHIAILARGTMAHQAANPGLGVEEFQRLYTNCVQSGVQPAAQSGAL